MVDSYFIRVASAIFTSLEETEVLPFCESEDLILATLLDPGRDLWLYCEEVDLEELQFLSSLHLYLITMKQKTMYGVLLFINKTLDRPCIASRRDSISCRWSEDEFFS